MADPQYTDPAGEGWHLDKRVPVALIVAILSQTAMGAYFIAQLDATATNNERRLTIVEERIDPMRQAIPRIEQILRDIQSRMDRRDRADQRDTR